MALNSFKTTFYLPQFSLIFLTLAVFSISLSNDFVWDDYLNIVDNRAIQSPDGLSQIFSREYLTSPAELARLSSDNVGFGELTYRPVATMTLLLDYRLWGLNPFGFHLTNLLIHVLNVLMVFILAEQLLDRRTFAFVAALIFAVHPIQGEAVMVASFREDLLALLFFLSAFLLYVKYQENRRLVGYIGSLAAYGLAVFSKEMAVSLPIILFVYDKFFVVPVTGVGQRRFLKNYLGYIAVAAFYLWIWSGPMGLADRGAGAHIFDNLYVHVLTMIKVVGVYFVWLLSGTGIHPTLPDQNFYAFGWNEPGVIGGMVLLGVCFFLVAYFKKDRRTISFGLLFFFIALGPVLNIIPIENLMAARYLYLPSVGFFMAFTALVGNLLQGRVKLSRQGSRLAVSGLVLFYAFNTVAQGYHLSNELSFRLQMQKYYPDNPRIYIAIAGAYHRLGRYDETLAYFSKARTLDPGNPIIYLDMAELYLNVGEKEAVIRQLESLPGDGMYHSSIENKICSLYGQAGRIEESIRCFDALLTRSPEDANLYYNQAINFKLAGDEERSRELLRQVLEIEPMFEPALRELKGLR